MRTPDMIASEIKAYLDGVMGDMPTYAYETLSGLCDDLSEALTGHQRIVPSTEVLEVAAPASSCEIASRQKGEPAITVKSYAADLATARDEAVRIYNETVAMMREPEA